MYPCRSQVVACRDLHAFVMLLLDFTATAAHIPNTLLYPAWAPWTNGVKKFQKASNLYFLAYSFKVSQDSQNPMHPIIINPYSTQTSRLSAHFECRCTICYNELIIKQCRAKHLPQAHPMPPPLPPNLLDAKPTNFTIR